VALYSRAAGKKSVSPLHTIRAFQNVRRYRRSVKIPERLLIGRHDLGHAGRGPGGSVGSSARVFTRLAVHGLGGADRAVPPLARRRRAIAVDDLDVDELGVLATAVGAAGAGLRLCHARAPPRPAHKSGFCPLPGLGASWGLATRELRDESIEVFLREGARPRQRIGGQRARRLFIERRLFADTDRDGRLLRPLVLAAEIGAGRRTDVAFAARERMPGLLVQADGADRRAHPDDFPAHGRAP